MMPTTQIPRSRSGRSEALRLLHSNPRTFSPPRSNHSLTFSATFDRTDLECDTPSAVLVLCLLMRPLALDLRIPLSKLLPSSDMVFREAMALNWDSRFLRLLLFLVCELSSEKKLRASRFKPGDGGTSVIVGEIAKVAEGCSKLSLNRVCRCADWLLFSWLGLGWRPNALARNKSFVTLMFACIDDSVDGRSFVIFVVPVVNDED